MHLTMTLAALWQQEAIDQISPMKEATDLAGTAAGLLSTSARSLLLATHIFSAREIATLNLTGVRSTMVPSAFIACLGKKEHFTIFSDSPRDAASNTIRIDRRMAESNCSTAPAHHLYNSTPWWDARRAGTSARMP